ncbi:MAG: AraC family ligand binding domain-containing protein, partial [Spirochaetaceae bacterium]|nr:AraC family ligand binding domain-containing protein [Spirochaetaceae bacterium]
MKYITYKENRVHGSLTFPVGGYYINRQHPRYKMILHWHEEVEIIRVIEGELNISVDGRHYKATKGDIVFLSQGVLHSAIPTKCIYECLVFDLKYLYRNNTECANQLRVFATGEKKINLFLPSVNNDISSYVEII